MKSVILNALERLERDGQIPLSSLGPAVARELEGFGERTGSLQRVGKGRGAVLQVTSLPILRRHLEQVRPVEPLPEAPSRVRNLLRLRDTKAGDTGLDRQYVLFKTVGSGIMAFKEGLRLELGSWCHAMGCLALELSEATTAWQCDHPILLVENQSLFDHPSWIEEGWQGIVLYYRGMLSTWLVGWLARSRFERIDLFPDYDGVGLSNFARLKVSVPDAQWHWRTDWREALERFGNPGLWAKEEQRANVERLWIEGETVGWSDPQLRELVVAMRSQGKMLEQEWVLASR